MAKVETISNDYVNMVGELKEWQSVVLSRVMDQALAMASLGEMGGFQGNTDLGVAMRIMMGGNVEINEEILKMLVTDGCLSQEGLMNMAENKERRGVRNMNKIKRIMMIGRGLQMVAMLAAFSMTHELESINVQALLMAGVLGASMMLMPDEEEIMLKTWWAYQFRDSPLVESKTKRLPFCKADWSENNHNLVKKRAERIFGGEELSEAQERMMEETYDLTTLAWLAGRRLMLGGKNKMDWDDVKDKLTGNRFKDGSEQGLKRIREYVGLLVGMTGVSEEVLWESVEEDNQGWEKIKEGVREKIKKMTAQEIDLGLAEYEMLRVWSRQTHSFSMAASLLEV